MKRLEPEKFGPFEFRYYEDEKGEKRLDEVVAVSADGKTAFHMEEMDKNAYWFGITFQGWTCHINLHSNKKIRPSAEAWEDK